MTALFVFDQPMRFTGYKPVMIVSAFFIGKTHYLSKVLPFDSWFDTNLKI